MNEEPRESGTVDEVLGVARVEPFVEERVVGPHHEIAVADELGQRGEGLKGLATDIVVMDRNPEFILERRDQTSQDQRVDPLSGLLANALIQEFDERLEDGLATMGQAGAGLMGFQEQHADDWTDLGGHA